jgi:hypothetical protein
MMHKEESKQVHLLSDMPCIAVAFFPISESKALELY